MVCRCEAGAFGGSVWGSGAIGLTYTAPLRTLRITGAKPTKFSVTTEPPAFTWGTEADQTFLSTAAAADFGKATAEPHEIYHKTIGKGKGSADVAFYAKHLRHYSPLVRTWSARALKEKNTPDAQAAIIAAAGHADPRVRRAACDAVSGYDNWGRPFKATMPTEMVSAKILPAIVKTLNDPQAAWWEIDGALFALGLHQSITEVEQLRLIVALLVIWLFAMAAKIFALERDLKLLKKSQQKAQRNA